MLHTSFFCQLLPTMRKIYLACFWAPVKAPFRPPHFLFFFTKCCYCNAWKMMSTKITYFDFALNIS